MARPPAFAFAIALGVLLTACSGGSQPGVPYAGDPSADVQTVGDAASAVAHRPTGSSKASAAIGVLNALGSRLRDAADQNDEAQTFAVTATAGRCTRGTQFFAPDRSGDPNSTETVRYYDAGCRRPAIDTIRKYTSTGAHSESAVVTTSIYAAGNANPVAVRTSNVQFSNASFGTYGVPVAGPGYARTMQSQLNVGSQTRAYADSELVLVPASGSSNTFCQDAAGYSATGIPSLDRTFGFEGGSQTSPGATRTSRPGGFVTWSSTQVGTVYTGSIGALSIGVGNANASCPIATPAYTLEGGTALTTYTMPISVTFQNDFLYSVTISNASLPSGFSLDVRTLHSAGNAAVLYGTIKQGLARMASFHIDTFGNGTLTVTSTGAQYRIVDWTVTR
ncbi:MAG: hypothetical protein JO199_12710 [Candidatus Eremiobacteraeota bacterium]|nr:hypothetical protein [Candidatus Eremiobacteraeota bacterium]